MSGGSRLSVSMASNKRLTNSMACRSARWVTPRARSLQCSTPLPRRAVVCKGTPAGPSSGAGMVSLMR